MSRKKRQLAEELAQQHVLEWNNDGPPIYTDEFVGLVGLPKDARVVVEVRIMQPIKINLMEWGTVREPVAAGT